MFRLTTTLITLAYLLTPTLSVSARPDAVSVSPESKIEQRASASANYTTVPVDNIGSTSVVNITINGLNFSVFVDSDSSVTWVGMCIPYEPSPGAYLNTSVELVTQYGNGFAKGQVYENETVTIGDLIVRNVTLGAVNATGINFTGCPLDGFIGVGPQALNKGSMVYASNYSIVNQSYPTVMGLLYEQGQIEAETWGISTKAAQANITNGFLQIGGPAQPSSGLYATPLVQMTPASNGSYAAWPHVGVHFEAVYYGDEIISEATDCVLGTFDTPVIFPDAMYKDYMNLTNSTFDDKTGSLLVAPNKALDLLTLTFVTEDIEFPMINDAQVWSCKTSADDITGTGPYAYIPVLEASYVGLPETACVLGAPFLQRVYASFTVSPDEEAGPGVVEMAVAPWALEIINWAGCPV